MDIGHSNVSDDDAVARCAGGTTIKVILLNVDTVIRDIANGDVLVSDAMNFSLAPRRQ